MPNETLPRNATDLEKLLCESLAFTIDEIPINQLWNPQICPLDFLPILAYTLSVDLWDEAWDEEKSAKSWQTRTMRMQKKARFFLSKPRSRRLLIFWKLLNGLTKHCPHQLVHFGFGST